MLLIRWIQFHNYRSLTDLAVELRPQTVFVGANNVGKTSVLEALDAMLGTGRRGYGFTETDVSPGVTPDDGLEVIVTICPRDDDRFSDDETALFGMHVDLSTTPQQVVIAARAQLDEEGGFRTSLTYRKSDGHDDGPVRLSERQQLGVLLLPAMRDARHELSDRGGLWARLTELQPISQEARSAIDQLGREFGATVLESLLGTGAQSRLDAQVAGLVDRVLYAAQPGAALEFSLVPTDLSQALRRTEVRLVTPGSPAGRPLTEQSIGTQSVALFGLFRAYLDAVGQSVVAIGVEEPEAHLHPHAARSMVRTIRELPTQTLITTHSTSVTDAADPRDIVLLRRRGGRSVASAAGSLPEEDAKEVARYVGRVGSDFLFARAVLMVEGDSERLALPVFAAAIGLDFDVLGVSIVTVDGHKFEPFLRLLGPDALDIPTAVICDNDAAAIDLARQLARIGRLPPEVDPKNPDAAMMQAAGYRWWTNSDFEAVLTQESPDLYTEAIAQVHPGLLTRLTRTYAQTHQIAEPSPTDPAFLAWAPRKPSISKPAVARRTAELFSEWGRPVPAEISAVVRDVADRALEQARVTTGADETVGAGDSS